MLAEVYFNLPLFSAVLLLISGILLGYALWFPFRGETRTLTAQLSDLTARNLELAAALQEQQEAYAGLERDHQQQCDELATLSQSRQRMEELERELELSRQRLASASHDQSAEELQALQQQHHDLQIRYDALLDEMETSRQAQADLETTVTQLQQAIRESSQSALVSRQIADSYASLKDDLTCRLRSLEHELTQQGSDQRSWADRYAAMQRQYQELARQKSRLEAMYDDVSLDRDELIETIDSQRRRVQQLQTALENQTQTLNGEMATASEVIELRDQLRHTQRGLEQAREELSELLTDYQRLTYERDRAVTDVAALKEDLQHHQRTMETMGRSHEKSLAQLAQFERQQVELEQLVLDHEHTIETLRTNVIDLHDIQHKCVTLQCTIRDQAQELQAIRIDRDEIAGQLAAGQMHWEQVKASIGDYQQSIDELRAQREELLQSLQGERVRNSELGSALEDRTRRLELVRQQLHVLESLPQQVEHLQHTNLQLAAEVAALAAERDAVSSRATESSDLLEQLQNQLACSHQSVLALERDRDEAIAQLRRHQVSLETQSARDAYGPLVPVKDPASEPQHGAPRRADMNRSGHLEQHSSDDKAA